MVINNGVPTPVSTQPPKEDGEDDEDDEEEEEEGGGPLSAGRGDDSSGDDRTERQRSISEPMDMRASMAPAPLNIRR